LKEGFRPPPIRDLLGRLEEKKRVRRRKEKKGE